VGSVHLALFVDDIDAHRRQRTLTGSIQPIVVGPRAGGRAAYLSDAAGTPLEVMQRPRLTVDSSEEAENFC
jgi:hypothetical protein